MVYKALGGKMGNELHALALTTEEKNGWYKQKN
jgi:stress-induced morphogen